MYQVYGSPQVVEITQDYSGAFADAETWKLARPHRNVPACLSCLSYWTTQEDMLTAGIFHNINVVTIENAGLVEVVFFI
ncbi:hypothetical protein AgCh_009907 [Apium graveolens]